MNINGCIVCKLAFFFFAMAYGDYVIYGIEDSVYAQGSLCSQAITDE